MDWLTLGKVSLLVLTGLFGILALVKEPRDKATGRVTVSGWISLIGIIASAVVGVLVQLKESSEQEQARRATALQTLQLVQNTSQTIKDIQRVLSPLDEMRVSMELLLSCDDAKYREFCQSITPGADSLQTPAMLEKWPGGEAELNLSILFFRESAVAQNYIDGKTAYDERGDFNLWIIVGSRHVAARFLDVWNDGTQTHLQMQDIIPVSVQRNGRILSTLDFNSATMVVASGNDELSRMLPRSFEMKFKNGQRVTIDRQSPFTKVKGADGNTLYKYILPN